MLMKFREVMFFLLIVTGATLPVWGQEKTIKYDETFNVNPDAWVDLECKYGDIHVDTWDENRVTVKVEVRADGNDADDVEKMLNKVKVQIEGSARRVEVSSNMGQIVQWNSSSGSNNRVRIKFKDGTRVNLKDFSITYKISMPSSNNLEVANKYGDIFVGEIQGRTKLWLKYGNLKAQSLLGPTSLELAYSNKAHINHLGQGKLDISYSKLTLEDAQSLRTEAKYSEVEAERIDSLFSDSKYNSYRVGTVHALFGDDNYSNYKIGNLNAMGKVEMKYGNLKIGELGSEFEILELEGSYTDFVIDHVASTSYEFEFSSRYGDLRYPEALSVSQRHKENNSLRISGRKGKNPKGMIRITTSYGNAVIR